MIPRVVTFGEALLRLSPAAFRRFVQADAFDATVGGSEANVAVTLAGFGADARFVSKLPAHEIGQMAVNDLRRYGVDTSHIVRGGERLGIYFLETGASQRGSKVIYDRRGSAFTTLSPDELEPDSIFAGADWFHWSGITPALGPAAQRALKCMLEAAKAQGITISVDLNFRAKLWTAEEAQACMKPLMAYVDCCIANEEDAARCLGLEVRRSDVESGVIDESAYADLIVQMKNHLDVAAVAVTLRESRNASQNGWSAMMLDEKECTSPFRSRRYDISIIDRVGAGDAFAGGLIFGLLTKSDSRAALQFAAAAGALKQTVPGDFGHATADEVEKLVAGAGSGRVER